MVGIWLAKSVLTRTRDFGPASNSFASLIVTARCLVLFGATICIWGVVEPWSALPIITLRATYRPTSASLLALLPIPGRELSWDASKEAWCYGVELLMRLGRPLP